METITLPAKARTKTGSKAANDVRRAAEIPAIIYGHGMDTVSISVPDKLFNSSIRTEHGLNVLFEINVEGAKLKENTCRVKDYQMHPVTDKISHVDFMVVSMTETIEVHVRLKAKGGDLSPGVKAGGTLDLVHHEIEIECLPNQVPDFIEINVKDLEIGDAIHLKDITLPQGCVSTLNPDEVLVAVHAPRVEEEPTEPAEGDESAEPEVLTAKKKDGEEGDAPAGDAKAEKKPEKKEEK